jgi:hypothetical protein
MKFWATEYAKTAASPVDYYPLFGRNAAAEARALAPKAHPGFLHVRAQRLVDEAARHGTTIDPDTAVKHLLTVGRRKTEFLRPTWRL